MQQRRQLRWRLPAPAPPGPPVAACLGVALLAALCLAGTGAQDVTPSSATSPDVAASTPALKCKCRGNSSLDCSSMSLTRVTGESNTCGLTVVTIDVSNNLLESIEDLGEWYQVELNASFNSIREIRSSSLKSSLEVLDVSFNVISMLELEDAQALRRLNASRNQLVQMESLPDVCSLEWLDLSQNLLEKIPEGLKACKKLQMFNASDNKLKVFPDGDFEAFLDEDDEWTALVVDLRGNDLDLGDSSFRSLLQEANVTVSEDDCSCAKLSRGRASFTLCVSATCVDGIEYWASVNSTNATADTVADASRNGSTANETECEGVCATDTTSVSPSSTDMPSPTNALPSTNVQSSTTTSTTVQPTTSTTTTTARAIPSTTSTSSTTTPPIANAAAAAAAAASAVGRATGDSRLGGEEVVRPPSAEGPGPGPGSGPGPGPGSGPGPGPEPTPAPTPAPGRRRRSLYVTLGLTLVVLVAAGAGAAALFSIYKRRRRQLLEEQAQRIAMMPLVASTPRSLRAADDDFVP